MRAANWSARARVILTGAAGSTTSWSQSTKTAPGMCPAAYASRLAPYHGFGALGA